MKMTKKFLIGAAIAALVLGLASCNPEIGDIEWSGGDLSTGSGSKEYKVKNQKNEAKGTIRGMKRFDAFKRAGATCVVQIFDQTGSSSAGVAGFASFVSENADNLTENGKKTMNFLVSSVRRNNGHIQTYVSYYCNVDPDKLSTQNFGVTDTTRTAFAANVKTPYEIVIADWFDLNSTGVVVDGTLKVAIDFIGKDDGTIDVNWYSVTEKLKSGDEAAANFDPAAYGSRLHNTVTATTTHLGTQSGARKGHIYAYANIYAGKTLNAQWNLYNATWSQAEAFADEEPCDLPDVAGDIFFN